MSELVLHTVAPQYTEAESPLSLPPPFERVVRLALAGEAPVPQPPLDEEEPAVPELIVRSFEIPHSVAIRTVLAFANVIDTKNLVPGYNCHSYASYASGAAPSPYAIGANRRAAHIIADGVEATHPLPAGQQGVIGYLKQEKRLKMRAARPRHSILGLGPDTPYCLQVTNTWGSLALSTYEGILSDRYQVGKSEKSPHLYVQKA